MIFWLTFSFFFSQVLAGIAIIADICSFQFKERKKMILLFVVATVCIWFHYFFLERYVAAIVTGIASLRFFISYFSTESYWIYVFSVIFIGATYAFYVDIYDFIILLWMLFATFWAFQKNDRYLRQFMMLGTSLFIVYDILIFSPVWMLLESIFLWSNLVGYYRYYLKK